MTHYGLICLAASGHLNPMTTLGYELKQRGHRVTLFGIPDSQEKTLAARIAWSGCGEALNLKKLNVPRLKVAINKVLTEESYHKNALRLQQAIKTAGGVSRAADIVERVVSTGKPVKGYTHKTELSFQ